MATIAPPITDYFDFRKALTKKKLAGLWRMMADFRLAYAAANFSLAVSALAKMFTYILLRNFASKLASSSRSRSCSAAR